MGFLFEIEIGKTISVSKVDFQWPTFDYRAIPDFPPDLIEWGRRLSFDKWGNEVLKIEIKGAGGGLIPAEDLLCGGCDDEVRSGYCAVGADELDAVVEWEITPSHPSVTLDPPLGPCTELVIAPGATDVGGRYALSARKAVCEDTFDLVVLEVAFDSGVQSSPNGSLSYEFRPFKVKPLDYNLIANGMNPTATSSNPDIRVHTAVHQPIAGVNVFVPVLDIGYPELYDHPGNLNALNNADITASVGPCSDVAHLIVEDQAPFVSGANFPSYFAIPSLPKPFDITVCDLERRASARIEEHYLAWEISTSLIDAALAALTPPQTTPAPPPGFPYTEGETQNADGSVLIQGHIDVHMVLQIYIVAIQLAVPGSTAEGGKEITPTAPGEPDGETIIKTFLIL